MTTGMSPHQTQGPECTHPACFKGKIPIPHESYCANSMSSVKLTEQSQPRKQLPCRWEGAGKPMQGTLKGLTAGGANSLGIQLPQRGRCHEADKTARLNQEQLASFHIDTELLTTQRSRTHFLSSPDGNRTSWTERVERVSQHLGSISGGGGRGCEMLPTER